MTYDASRSTYDRREQMWAETEVGRRVLDGRPMPARRGRRPGSLVESDLAWQQRAACQGADEVTAFVLTDATRQSDLGARDLDDLCTACPVAYQCLTAGLSTRGWGVWGGMVLEDGRPAATRRPATSRRVA